MASIIITINIELKPYLRKFLLAKSANKSFPLKFPNKHDYNIMLVKMLTNYNSLTSIPVGDRQNVIEYFKEPIIKHEDNISIILPMNSRKDIRSYNYLSVKSKRRFAHEVKTDFYFEFSRFLRSNLLAGVERSETVKKFKSLYNITEDELKDETLYRYSTRMLNKITFNKYKIKRLQPK